MRRSKSDPARYARGYKKISQRRMTGPGNVDNFDDAGDETMSSPAAEEKEMERLRQIMRTSRAHLDRAAAVRNGTSGSLEDDNNDEDGDDGGTSKKKKRKRSKKNNDNGDVGDADATGDDADATAEDNAKESIFSPEMQKEMDAIGAGCDDCVILPTKKKKKKSAKVVELTPEEIKAARAQHKNAARKLKQLADRKEQKKKRAELYATLRENAISSEERELLASSSTLGKRVSKKEQLQRLIRKERAGIDLTEDEKNILYTERKVGGGDGSDDPDHDDVMNVDARVEEKGAEANTEATTNKTKSSTDACLDPDSKDETNNTVDDAKAARQKRKKERRKKRKLEQKEKSAQLEELEEAKNEQAAADGDAGKSKEDFEQPEIITPFPKETSPPPVFNPASFAASMMADLSSLKTTAAADTEALRKKEAAEAEAAETERLRLEEEERKKRKVYVPSEPILVKTAATLGLQSKDAGKSNWRVLPVDRPEEIEKGRFDLPVSAMEFEIVDAVRSSDATIICAETGSGKSTQVVQMLYGECEN